MCAVSWCVQNISKHKDGMGNAKVADPAVVARVLAFLRSHGANKDIAASGLRTLANISGQSGALKVHNKSFMFYFIFNSLSCVFISPPMSTHSRRLATTTDSKPSVRWWRSTLMTLRCAARMHAVNLRIYESMNYGCVLMIF